MKSLTPCKAVFAGSPNILRQAIPEAGGWHRAVPYSDPGGVPRALVTTLVAAPE